MPYPLLICVCNYVSHWGWKLGVGCLWWEARGDWWFTEERWWVIHLHKARQSLWQHEWPVICHPAQRPPLRSAVGWDIYSPSASHPEASAYISLNCEAAVRQSKAACLSSGPHVCLLVVSPPVCPLLQSFLASLQPIQMGTERTWKETLAWPLTCRGISISPTGRLISQNITLSISVPLLVSFVLTAPICISVSHSMMKHALLGKKPEFLTICLLSWQDYLSDCQQASLFICISDWLSPIYSPCMFLVFSSCLPCNHVSVFFFLLTFNVCLPTSSPLCPHVCWALCLATHWDWHLTMQQERVTGNSLLWRSLKHDWQYNQHIQLGE